MTIKRSIYIGLGLLFFLLTWLFTGIFRDDEFYDPYLFTKYRPTFKVMFYSPIGMQDLALEDLSADRRLEELAFQEFVIEPRRQNNDNAAFWYVPFMLIQLTLTFLTFGIGESKRWTDDQLWLLPIHFVINLIATSMALGLMLLFDNVVFTITGMLVIGFFNYATRRLCVEARKWWTAVLSS